MNAKMIGSMIALSLAGGYGCAKPLSPQTQSAASNAKANSTLILKSSAFAENTPIPTKFTCDGANVSPALEWSSVPKGTKSLVLICIDPDAPSGTFTHWIVYNIPVTATKLAENLPKIGESKSGIRQGKNGFGKIGYGGPCPPKGDPHHYHFQLSALNIKLALKGGVSLSALEAAIGEHRIGETETIGTYQKK